MNGNSSQKHSAGQGKAELHASFGVPGKAFAPVELHNAFGDGETQPRARTGAGFIRPVEAVPDLGKGLG